MSKADTKANRTSVTISPVDEEHARPSKDRTASSSSTLSIKTPRSARFTEATSVISPIDPPTRKNNPFTGSPIVTRHVSPQLQPADVGFGYMDSNSIRQNTVEMPMTPFTPLRSALKPPGTPGRFIDPRSPTFKEEVHLEKEEIKAEKENAKDLKIKTRVRIAKFFLRGVNFSCSLIILSMLSTTFAIFNETKAIPPRNNLPPWAQGQSTWPQITLLVISCVSLAICMAVFWSYRRGHKKATKTASYYTYFAIGSFIFSTVMWIIGAAVLHGSRASSNNQDMWGWSCNQNKRATLFQDEVNYGLVCRLQNWGLVCALIEIVVELLTITIYAFVFYRFHSKNRLRKSMNNRDRARSDLYLAQLKIQSAPNTPGFKSARTPGVGFAEDVDAAEKGDSGFTAADAEYAARHKEVFGGHSGGFALQPPPIKVHGATPQLDQKAFEANVQEHAPVAPGEQTYDAVPIPGAYAGFQPQEQQQQQQQGEEDEHGYPKDVKHTY